VELDEAGIDLIAEDIGRPLEAQNGAIIEVNASPGLVMHLKPLIGKPRPVGEAIVKHLFPPGETGRVPLLAVSGTNGKTEVASLVAAMLAVSSRTVGQATSNGLRVGQRGLAASDATDATSARRLLVNPFVDAIVLETSEINVIREGLAFDRCQVAVVTNLGGGDHMGELYVDTRELVGKAVRAPVDVVLPEGFAVLNAGEPDVAAMAEKCRGGIVYFAADGDAGPLPEHLAKGGRAVFVSGGAIVAAQGGQLQRLFDIEKLRSSALGLPRTRVENLLAAAGAGIGLGLTPTAIRQGLETQPNAALDRIYALQDQRVLVTRARNPSALAAWVSVMEDAFPDRKRHAAIEIPSDWRAEDAAAASAVLREAFASLVLVRGDGNPTVENLCRKITHPTCRSEKTWDAAMERIFGEAGPSDFMFVGPSKRAGCDSANEHCTKRNMVRLS
jgi:cyanophycin synthetase